MLIIIFYTQIPFSHAWHTLGAGKYLPCYILFHPKRKAIGCIHIPQHLVLGPSWALFGILRPLDSYDFLCILFSSKGLKHCEDCDGALTALWFYAVKPCMPCMCWRWPSARSPGRLQMQDCAALATVLICSGPKNGIPPELHSGLFKNGSSKVSKICAVQTGGDQG